jgi:hypothetical protein
MSIPLGLAAIDTVLAPEDAAGVEEVVAGVLVAGVLVAFDVVLELLPQPARATAATAVAAKRNFVICMLLCWVWANSH